MLRLLAVLCVLGLTVAVDFDCCTAEDRSDVQKFWAGIWSAEFNGRRSAVAKAVFEDFFERDEDAKQAFSRVNVDNPDSPEFKAHVLRVVNGVGTVVGLYDNSAELKLHLGHLGEQHKTRPHVRPEHFEMIGRSLEKVLPQVGACFNKLAWTRCFASVTASLAAVFN